MKDIKDVVSRVQRELPDTDQDRYDIAYERGRAQARSGLMFGGLAVGSAIGAGLMWLLDPARGKGRRAELTQRATGLRNRLARTAGGRAEDLQNRVQGFAIERGIKEPPGGREPEAVSGMMSGAAGYAPSVAGGSAATEPEPLQTEEIPVHATAGTPAGSTLDQPETGSDHRTDPNRVV